MRVNMAIAILGILAGCAVENAEPAGDRVGETAAALEKAPANGVGTSSSTWVYLGTESCFDFFLRPCNDSRPFPQCPGIAAGQPCSPSGAWCNKVLAGNTFFEQYLCN